VHLLRKLVETSCQAVLNKLCRGCPPIAKSHAMRPSQFSLVVARDPRLAGDVLQSTQANLLHCQDDITTQHKVRSVLPVLDRAG